MTKTRGETSCDKLALTGKLFSHNTFCRAIPIIIRFGSFFKCRAHDLAARNLSFITRLHLSMSGTCSSAPVVLICVGRRPFRQ